MSLGRGRDESVITCDPAQLQEAEDDVCPSYFTYTYQSSGEVVDYKRAYRTLSQMIGSIGGIQSLVMLALVVVYAPINRHKRNSYLVKRVYSLLVAGADAKRAAKPDSVDLMLSNILDQQQSADAADRKTGCCRKAKSKEGEVKQRQEQALHRIDDSMDILKLVRDLNLLKVLTHILLRDRHLGLAQLVGFELWKKEEEQEKTELAGFHEDTRSVVFYRRDRAVRQKRLAVEAKQYPTWISEVQENIVDDADALREKDELEKFVDYFYQQKLSRNSDRPTMPPTKPLSRQGEAADDPDKMALNGYRNG